MTCIERAPGSSSRDSAPHSLEQRRMGRVALIVTLILPLASPASAQWSQVTQVPTANIYSVFAKGDTLAASSDSTVFVSTDAGATWIASTAVVARATQLNTKRADRGRLYAKTFG